MLFTLLTAAALATSSYAFPNGPFRGTSNNDHSRAPDYKSGGDGKGRAEGPKEDGLSICDKYATQLFGGNNYDTQSLLATVFVNQAAAGNYTPISQTNGVGFPGFINPGGFHGVQVNQLPYFNGQLNSTNVSPDRGHGVAVNWLDGGGQPALHQNLSAFEVNSNQFFYFVHLYEYFAYMLDCSVYGNSFDRYNGSTDMYHVHKYMNINKGMEGYTNLQFVLSGASLGFSKEAQAYIGQSLQRLFSFKCEPPQPFPHWAEPASQSICQAENCPTFPHHPVCLDGDRPVPQIVAAPGESHVRVYSCENDTDDIDQPGDGCLAV